MAQSPAGCQCAGTATGHRKDAIASGQTMLISYRTRADTVARGVPERWLRSYPECKVVLKDEDGKIVTSECDEYPDLASGEGGPAGKGMNLSTASLRQMPVADNQAEGGQYWRMVRVTLAGQQGRYFLTILMPQLPVTLQIDGDDVRRDERGSPPLNTNN